MDFANRLAAALVSTVLFGGIACVTAILGSDPAPTLGIVRETWQEMWRRR